MSGEERAARADRLFASLTEQAEQSQRDTVTPSFPGPPGGAAAGPVDQPEHSSSPEDRPLTEREIHDILITARAAMRRTVRVVKVVRSQANDTAADLAALAEALAQVLEATNARLAALEHLVLGELGPGAAAAEQATALLRSSLRSSADGDVGTPAS